MTEKRKTINVTNVILFFSLALNFFVAGYFISDRRVSHFMQMERPPHKKTGMRIVDFFPPGQRQKFHGLMRENRDILMPIDRQIFDRQKEIFQTLAEKNINEDRLRQAFITYQDSNNNMQGDINNIVIKMLLDMDYKARISIIRRGQKAHEKQLMMKKKWREDKEKFRRKDAD